MTITIFIKPTTLIDFIEVTNVLKGINLDNNYEFNPSDIVFSERMISDWVWINMEVNEYIKLKYYVNKLSEK